MVSEHVTFSANAAGTAGENLFLETSSNAVDIVNSLFAAGVDESVSDCELADGNIGQNLNNLSEDGTCDDNESGLIVADPRLEALGANGGTPTFGLLADSPAIDAADDGNCASQDQRSVVRNPLTCDIGAFELTAPIVVDEISAGIGAVAITAADGVCSLPEALLNSVSNSQIFPGADECEPGTPNAADRVILPADAVFTLTAPDLVTPTNGLPRLSARTTIQGNGATITRDSDRQFRHISNYGELTIQNLTMSNGYAPAYGGGVRLTAAKADSIDKGIGGGRANNGGAIFNTGTLVMDDVTLSGNVARRSGGGLYASMYREDASLTISNSTFVGNTAVTGGGFGLYGEARLVNSTISGNTAMRSAQSLFVDSESAVTAGYGYYFENEGVGGGISTRYRGELVVINSTIASNTAQTNSGISFGTTLSLTNTLVTDGADNTSPECAAFDPFGNNGAGLITNLSNLIEDGSCNAAFSAPGQLLVDPISDNGGNTLTHALILTDNPAIDAGDVTACADLTFDQRGDPFDRTVGGACDIGAFETDGVTPTDVIFGGSFE